MPIKHQIIVVDIDDVLVPHFQTLVDWYNHRFGTQLTAANHSPVGTSVELAAWGATSYREAVERVHEFFDTPAFLDAKPYPEAANILRHLGERYVLEVVTSRDTLIADVTHRWLEEYFHGLFAAVYFTARYSLEGKSRSKLEVCQEIGASYLLDDTLASVTQAAADGIQAVLFGDYEWNKTETLPTRITRCRDWKAVQEYFDGRS